MLYRQESARGSMGAGPGFVSFHWRIFFHAMIWAAPRLTSSGEDNDEMYWSTDVLGLVLLEAETETEFCL